MSNEIFIILSEDKISNFKSYYEEYFYSRSAYLSILKSINIESVSPYTQQAPG